VKSAGSEPCPQIASFWHHILTPVLEGVQICWDSACYDYLYQGEGVAELDSGSILAHLETDHGRLASIAEERRFNRCPEFLNDNPKATACVSGKLLQALPRLGLADVNEALMPL
jgi:hypothetical protein